MAEPVDFLIDILCRGNSASDCQSFVSGYPDPASQLVFFLFFPVVFLIIFVHLLTSNISEKTKDLKIQTLLSIAIVVFIVFQGWYHWFLSISKFWFIAVIILGGFWVLFNRMGPASKGSGSSTRGLGSSIGKMASKKLRSTITREEEDLRKAIKDDFRRLEGFYNSAKNNPGSEASVQAKSELRSVQRSLRQKIDNYGSYGKIQLGSDERMQIDLGKQAKGFWEDYEKWSNKIKDLK